MSDVEMKDAELLLVEDDQDLAALIRDELDHSGYPVTVANSLTEALRSVRSETPPDLIVSDLRLPDGNGRDLLRYTQALPIPPSFLVMTAFGTIPQAVECLRDGADDFLTKPLDLDHLLLAVERSLETRALRAEVQRYRDLLQTSDFHGMVGRSRVMRELFDHIGRVAKGDGPVLILGESGVGKELVARAIHSESGRAAGPFLAVNCAGIPAELLESEFFGHVAGAFTGARGPRRGLFEEASGGTLLLDEIGEMPLDLQAKLLRVLQEQRVRPVGSNREIEVDVRVLASTNRNLETAVSENAFREDLFYRLETFQLHVPPLRERDEDIELLASRFLARHAERLGKELRGFDRAALDRLTSYPFPGNVRELENAIERAATFAAGPDVGLADLPQRLREGGDGKRNPSGAPIQIGSRRIDSLVPLEEIEQAYTEFVLEAMEGNKRAAAKVLGISRRTLYRRLE